MAFSRATKLCRAASVLLVIWGSPVHAAGLGPIVVQSGFGQPLRATVPLLGADASAEGSQCIRARLESLDGATVITPRIGLQRSQDATSIRLSTSQNINELAMKVTVDIGCDVAVQRNYQILLDPVEMLPAVPASASSESHEDQARQRPMHAMLAGASEANPAGPAHRASRKTAVHVSRERANSENNTPAPVRKSKPARSEKHAGSPRSVLRMSSLDDMPLEEASPSGLKMSDTLSGAGAAPDPQRLAELRAEQARLAAFLRGEDPARTAQDSLTTAQREIEKLRKETDRIQRQQQSDRKTLESVQAQSRDWIRSLQALLAICVAAVAWLLWRFYLIRKNAAAASWDELLRDREGLNATTSSGLDANSEFNTSAFGSFNTSGFENSQGAEQAPEPSFDLRRRNDLRAAPDEERTLRGSSATPHAVQWQQPKPSLHPDSGPLEFTSRNPRPEDALKLEEISDVMELADAWMALHDPMKVLEILEPFHDVEQPESPLPWLCLLDVYRSLGDRQKYEAILERIKKIYNVRLAPWDVATDAEPPRTLADFPHIIETALSLWEGAEVVPYLEGLMIDDREGTRTGFDLPVYRDIIRLLNMANAPEGRKPREEIARAFTVAPLAVPRTESAKPAIAEKMPETQPESAPRKPQLRARPKYITTSYQRTVARRDNLAQNLAPAEETAVEAVPATLHEAAPATPAAQPDEAKHSEYDAMSPMAIKLHLAMAYQDIGDKEGAFLLLEEVIHEGTPEQVEQARALRAKLG